MSYAHECVCGLTRQSYSVCFITSGAIQNGVPTNVLRFCRDDVNWVATPKSANLTSPLSDSRILAAISTQGGDNVVNVDRSCTFNISVYLALSVQVIKTLEDLPQYGGYAGLRYRTWLHLKTKCNNKPWHSLKGKGANTNSVHGNSDVYMHIYSFLY